jgi:putative membrane-bound dehydrogenase-like protein
MRDHISASVVMLVIVSALAGGASHQSGSAAPASSPRRIEILFLGHASEHHHSARFAPMLKAALAPEGLNFSYTEDPNDLNAGNLALYDALVIYANHTKITPEQERALLDFVAGGKGFLPIHSASYCFRNSDAYVSLVGAQFERHGTGEFTAEIVKPDHPVLDGIKPFQVWDETYVHTKHNPDRVVLMERVDEKGREPWTWVRTHGKGRVFYTAYGHDDRVWGHPSFHRLVRNAILWAVAPDVRERWSRLSLEPLTYSKTEVPVPNYERRNPPPLYQEPLAPAEAMKRMQVPAGFELQLFASEPQIVNPIAMAWDERGRLWVLETLDYPNRKQPDGQGNDVLKILEDTNDDGRADKSTIFADKLSIPTSLVFVDGGVLVSQAPDFIFLKDTDGDDRADVRESRITGFGVRDTHAGPSNLKYGLDNWLWGTVGYSGFQGTIGGKPFKFSQGVYRFTPDARQFEWVTNFTNNTWGLAFTESFDVFGSTANGEHSVYVAIPNRFYEGVRGLRGDGKKKIDGHYAMHANTPKIRQVDVHGGFTAAAGHNFYTARAFPQEYWNRVALISEPTGHLVHRGVIRPKGSGFTEIDNWNLLESDDEWVSPVHAEVGPDGAVWILDWYHFIVQHNPTPAGENAQGHPFRNGPGNAYETPLRDSQRGRIYRLAWKAAKPYAPLSLSVDRPRELVQALRHDNMFWRTTAQRLLVQRGKTDVLSDLYPIVNDRSIDRVGLNSPAVHALWTMHGLRALDGSNGAALDVARRALAHPAAGVRKTAIAVLPRTAQSITDLLAAKVLDDADLNVRLHALLALADMPASKEAGRAVYAMSRRRDVIEDEWLPEAIFVAAGRHTDAFFTAYAEDIGIAEFTRLAVRGARGELGTFSDWSAPGLADTSWKPIKVPAQWTDTPLRQHLGVAWFRRTFELPDAAAGKPAALRLGIVDDGDMTFINGSRVGATPFGPNAPREYSVPPGVLLPGRNVIAVRVSNVRGRGGIIPDETGVTLAGEGFRVSLGGEWRHQIEETWEGGRRREISTTAPIAQQFLRANSPVSDLVKPPTPAAAPRAQGPGPSAPLVVQLAAVPAENRYNQTSITVKAGQRVQIVFSNTDDMQHNVVIVQRDGYPAFEKTLIAMLTDPNAQKRGFVPESPLVLFATPLVDPRQAATLEFTAPAEPGDYPYVCTFPGHWFTMRGVLKVE